MPSVDELLNMAEVAEATLTETNDKIEIDADTRTMIIQDTERIFGVMSDEKGERKYFRCKRFVGNGIDLSKLSLRIVFQNASGLETGRDKYIVTDLATDGEDYVTFSWELSRKVTAYKGIISFVVCAIKTNSDGIITNEWNTTLANGIVLEGLEANGTQEQEEVAKDYYNQLEAELLKVANEQINKVQEVVKTIPSDYTQMQKDVSNLKEELTDGRTDVDGNAHGKIGDAMRGQVRKLRENLVVRQKEQPTDPNNNVWISDEDDEVEVPDMREFNSLKEDLGNLSIVKIGENKCTNKNEVYGSTIYLPVYLEKSKSYIIYNPTSETLKGCNINVVNSENDNILIAVKSTGWVIPSPKDRTQSFLSTVNDGWYRIRLSYQSVFTEEQKAMYGIGWMVKEIPTVDYVPTSFDYVEYKENILAKESVNAEKANYAEKAGSIVQKEENVACRGDSLTYGYGASHGSTDYPSVLAKLCGKTIYNLGVSGESTDEILARQGGFPAVINPINIPAETSAVEITFSSNINIGADNTVLLRKDSGKLVNPVIIDGVEGNISVSNNKYYFTRLEDGTAHEIKHPQYVITKEMREHKDDIQIIFMGTNGGWMITADDAETRIKKLTSQIDMMIDYNTSKKYIIIGMHYFYSWVLYNGLTKEQIENAMLLKYGNHYINLRKYMIEYGLSDAGLTETEADTEAINNGNVPPSLLYSDGIHGNAYFYNILANLVNKKGIELGYWN